MLEVISLLGVVKNYLPHPEPGPFGLLATLQLSCQTAPVHIASLSPVISNVVQPNGGKMTLQITRENYLNH